MDYVEIAGGALRLSRLAFGCWGITSDMTWGERDRAESVSAIHAALDSGINFFDTAEMYGEGASEELLGQELASQRDSVILASKPRPDSMRADQVVEACERSLKRLSTDHLDLYQLHWPNPDVPVSESWQGMLKLKEQGKVRQIGVCNFGRGNLEVIRDIEPPVSNQLPYNLLWRAIEDQILPACREQNVAVLAYSPLMHGLLADKFKSADEVPDGRARSRHFSTDRPLARHGEAGCEELTFDTIHRIRKIAKAQERSMADIAVAWLFAQGDVHSVIIGARNADQIQDNVSRLGKPLDQSVVNELNAATDELKRSLGPNPDLWQGTENSRYR